MLKSPGGVSPHMKGLVVSHGTIIQNNGAIKCKHLIPQLHLV